MVASGRWARLLRSESASREQFARSMGNNIRAGFMVVRCGKARHTQGGLFGWGCDHVVQSKIEWKHVHSRFAQQAEAGAVSVLADEFAHLVLAQAAGFGDARGLEFGVARADVGVEAAAGGGHGVGGDGRVGGESVLRAVVGDVLRDGVGKLLGGGAEVAAAGVGGVVAVAGGGRAGVEVFVGGELLAQQA